MRSTSQLQPIDEVCKCSDLGDHYMSNQQWNNAVTMYERALVTREAILEPGAPLPSITPAHLERLAAEDPSPKVRLAAENALEALR